jgi:hypothetical protein
MNAYKLFKKLWTFEWFEMGHIFISPYHSHFLWISIFFSLIRCMLKIYFKWFFSYGLFNLINYHVILHLINDITIDYRVNTIITEWCIHRKWSTLNCNHPTHWLNWQAESSREVDNVRNLFHHKLTIPSMNYHLFLLFA